MSIELIDDYQRQIRILDTLLHESQAVRRQFDSAREQYQGQIRQAQRLGYMGDYVDQLEQRYREFSAQMDEALQTLIRGELRIAEQQQRLYQLTADAMSQD